jgi:hypothetical protein
MLSLEHFSPSILRVNKQMYSEGYNVMIKVNRFVLVTCTGGLYFAHMLMQNDVPFLAIGYGPGISSSDPATRDFRGHAIHVTIGNSKDDWQRDLAPSQFVLPCNIIMLFRDLELLCQAIMRGDDLLEDHMKVVLISIELGPAAIVPPYQTEAPTTYFSSTKVQELLEPFRRRIRDMPRVDIGGIVDESLVQSTLKDLARDKFEELDDLIESWRARVAQGTKLFEQGNRDGSAHWFQVNMNITKMHDGPMWTRLVKRGGSSFVGKVAEFYYTTNLNIVALLLLWLEEGRRDVMSSIRDAYENMRNSQEAEYWGMEHSWEPSLAEHTDNMFQYTKFCRLWGVPTLIPFAVATIDKLVHEHPNNPEFLDEKRKIEA